MSHPTLYLSGAPHVFGDVRDAIDAVSAFEASTIEFFSYNIASFNPACPLTGYTVAVYAVQEGAAVHPSAPYGWLRDAG